MAASFRRCAFQKLVGFKYCQCSLLTDKFGIHVRSSSLAKIHSGSPSLGSRSGVKTDSSVDSENTTASIEADDADTRKPSESRPGEALNKSDRYDYKTDHNLNEKVLLLNFGTVRFDGQNVVTKHGQYEDDVSLEHFPRLKESALKRRSKDVGDSITDHSGKDDVVNKPIFNEPSLESSANNFSSYIDDQYFSLNSGKYINPRQKEARYGEAVLKLSFDKTVVEKHSNFIDEQYFSELFNTSLNNDNTNRTSQQMATFLEEYSDINHNLTSFTKTDIESSKVIENSGYSQNHYSSPSLFETGDSVNQQASHTEVDPFHIEYLSSDSVNQRTSHTEVEYLSNDETTSPNLYEQPVSDLPLHSAQQHKRTKNSNKDENHSKFRNSETQGSVKNKAKNFENNFHVSRDASQENIPIDIPKTDRDFGSTPLYSEINRSKFSNEQDNEKLSDNLQHERDLAKGSRKKIKNTNATSNSENQKQTSRERKTAGNSTSAYDYVKQKRREEKLGTANVNHEKKESTPVDTSIDGHKVFKHQVQDLRLLPKDIVLHILKCSVIYNANDIVAFNKPYGLASYGEESKILGRSLSTFLEDLAKHVDPENPQAKLYPIHRLDRDTTGVHLFAKSQDMARILHNMFKERKIEKTYLAITRGVPDPREGLINIPIMKGHVDDKDRMVLLPELSPELKPLNSLRGDASAATTYYKTLKVVDNAAFVEVAPETGVKHQVRVHLGFGLNCPVLGDHKYSDLKKMAPQKLPGDMLTKLNIRQSKVRYVPLHLHAKQIVIPGILDGKSIVISAQLPPHFVDNLKSLGLKK